MLLIKAYKKKQEDTKVKKLVQIAEIKTISSG